MFYALRKSLICTLHITVKFLHESLILAAGCLIAFSHVLAALLESFNLLKYHIAASRRFLLMRGAR
jgi:hypothetical protein